MVNTEYSPLPAPPTTLTRPTALDPEREARLAALEGFISERRRARIEWALVNRVQGLTVVLDRIRNIGNASAVMRTCDGFGLHRVFVVENTDEQYKGAHRISLGTHKWLDVPTFKDPELAIQRLRADGYRIAATTLDTDRSLADINPTGKLAVVLGGELDGVSPQLLDAADEHFSINMYGFAQSFNVSVAGALCVQDLMRRRREAAPQDPHQGDFPPDQLEALRECYYRLSVREADMILERLTGQPAPPMPMPLGTTLFDRALDNAS